MSSLILQKKSKLSPLNLTSETVHEILKKSQPQKSLSNRKIYPTAKYGTEEIRSTTDINSHIIKKIKELDRIYSEERRPGKIKSRTIFCQGGDGGHKGETGDAERDRGNGEEAGKSKNAKSVDEGQGKGKGSAQKYYDKANKIKNLKLKQYMRNKFAIDIKTIETTRDQKPKQKPTQKQSPEAAKDRTKYRPPKTQHKSKLVLKHHREIKINQEMEMEESPGETIQVQEEDGEEKRDVKNRSLVEMKLEKIMRRERKSEKAQTAVKSFEFSREVQQHPADIRFQKLLQDLNLILISHGCLTQSPKPLPPYTRTSPKYKFFVGPGNNKNLIVAIMKKRWWWTQTHVMSEAHFVWTQLKQLKVLEGCMKEGEEREVPEVLIGKGELGVIRKREDKVVEEFKSKLFHPKSALNEIQPAQIQKHSKQFHQLKTPQKLHNHYEGNSSLGNKKALFYYLSLYCEHKDIDRYSYIPLTFHISSPRSPEIKNLEKAFQNFPNSYWIIKPGENSNRGNGISVVKSLGQIKQQIKNLTTNTLIVQKYIDNLFLYCCRKFDIRTYMIAITIAGSTKFYWHSQGYLRTSSYIYNLKQHDNKFVHLTNDAIQSTNEKYSKYQEGNKLSYQQFQRYLDQSYRGKGYSIRELHQRMKGIARLAVEATYPRLGGGLGYGFQVFGLDFIVDGQFRPWLIEVNTNPCLELCSPCLERLIPQMLENVIRLAVDPVFQPCVAFPRSMSSSVPENILASNRFSVIFDDFYDRDREWEAKISQAPLQIDKDQQQQQFTGDGEILTNI